LTYRKLRDLGSEIRTVDASAPGFSGSPDRRFRRVDTTVAAKVFHNDAHGSDMALAKLYSTGPLKDEATGRCCGTCLNFYPVPALENSKQGRCKARGFLKVSEDTPADYRPHGWTDKASGVSFSEWPACPYYAARERMSRK
jgi:hypothetical protein